MKIIFVFSINPWNGFDCRISSAFRHAESGIRLLSLAKARVESIILQEFMYIMRIFEKSFPLKVLLDQQKFI